MKTLQWAYLTPDGKPVYQDITGKVDLYVSAQPKITLMVFKYGNNWIAADFATGIKLGVYTKKGDAKKNTFTPESATTVYSAFIYHKKHGRTFPEVNGI